MRRRTLRIVLFLILGCVTTVAVAWVCTLWKPIHDRAAGSDELAGSERHQRWWREHAPESWGQRAGTVFSVHYLGLTRVVHYEHEREDWPVDPMRMATRVTAGWPLRSLDGAVFHSVALNMSNESIQVSGLMHIDVSWLPIPRDSVPLRPIWPGFVINALFYGVIWFGIFFCFGNARRTIRKRRGRCPKCDYDLRGELDKGCSECGWGRLK